MDNLRRLGDGLWIPITPDEDGFVGRECPRPDCLGYFKIEPGTGLEGEGLPCHCPYCGHTAGHDHFWTKEQIEYAKSVAMRQVTDALHKDLKKMEFDRRPKGGFGIGMSLKVKQDSPVPIHYYRERQLETEVVCSNCTLRYSVYGVFAFCPDCGQHNSLQILNKNLELVHKMLDFAATVEAELAARLVENALEDCVASFDGFGREICRFHGNTSEQPNKAEKVSFQNLEGGRQNFLGLFNVDIASELSDSDWKAAIRAFQKRHLLSHKMGVIDEEYARKSGDAQAVVGRRVKVDAEEVREISRVVGVMAQYISISLEAK